LSAKIAQKGLRARGELTKIFTYKIFLRRFSDCEGGPGMGIAAVRGSLQDRRGLVSLEYAVLAAAVVTAVFAATGAFHQRMCAPFDRMEAAAVASS
jgi:hypothetical protein